MTILSLLQGSFQKRSMIWSILLTKATPYHLEWQYSSITRNDNIGRKDVVWLFQDDDEVRTEGRDSCAMTHVCVIPQKMEGIGTEIPFDVWGSAFPVINRNEYIDRKDMGWMVFQDDDEVRIEGRDSFSCAMTHACVIWLAYMCHDSSNRSTHSCLTCLVYINKACFF